MRRLGWVLVIVGVAGALLLLALPISIELNAGGLTCPDNVFRVHQVDDDVVMHSYDEECRRAISRRRSRFLVPFIFVISGSSLLLVSRWRRRPEVQDLND